MKKSRKLIALLLSCAMVLSVISISAFAIEYSDSVYEKYAPTELMDVDDDILSGATAAANTTALSFLGIDVTSTDAAGALNSAGDPISPLNLLVFGSEANESPDPYLWNFYYNLNKYGYPGDVYDMETYYNAGWTGAYTLLNNAKSGPTGQGNTDNSIRIGVNGSYKYCDPVVFYAPDVLMGASVNSYDYAVAHYRQYYNPLYNPLQLGGWGTDDGQYAMRDGTFASTVAMANGVYNDALEIEKYLEENEIDKVSRYNGGDVVQCGVDYSSFALGIYYYIQSRLNPINPLIGSISKAGYCTGISVNIYGGEITVTNENSPLTTRYLQYLDGIADLAETGKTYASYGDLKKDVDLVIMDTSKLTDSQLRMLNQVNIKVVDINSVMPNTVYGTTMQSADNILGIPYFVGLLYEGRLSNYSTSLSEFDYIAYFVKHLYHVEDEDVATVVAEMVRNGCGDVNNPYKSLTNGYDGYIGSLIKLGAAYYKECGDLGSGIWQAVDDGNFDMEAY